MPDNWSFVAAAYGLTAAVLLWYWLRLGKKEREIAVLTRLTAERSRGPSSSGHPRPEPGSRTPLQQNQRPGAP
ncbi:MAG TPA: hypothetical protein VGT02_11950 [Methylomirabilota bacterium]|jgi:hypothetical protein|nr:hypothetical protein [Methylomirabilota bacterium]